MISTDDKALLKMMGMSHATIQGIAMFGFTRSVDRSGLLKVMFAGSLVVPKPIWREDEAYGKMFANITIEPIQRWKTNRRGLGAEGVCLSLTDTEMWEEVAIDQEELK
jgi:hypothetical protein